MRILVLTRSYPAAGDLYKYPFVHRRVLAYSDAGHQVAVFRPDNCAPPSSHEFEGVTCRSGGSNELRDFAASWSPDVVAVHGLSEALWDVIQPIVAAYPVRAWLHGSEIPEFMRQKALVTSPSERAAALEQVQERCAFWQRLFDDFPSSLQLVFVSETSVGLALQDWGTRLRNHHFSVIPNPVDTELFRYREKTAEDRFNILLIRPFDSHTYANDLAVQAISNLLAEGNPAGLRFTIIGDGPLFDETLTPLWSAANVTVERRFLRQEEIVEEHKKHGIFLVPTRLDTQGVSRDEAMASGLVPVTNAISAVREFVDESCAALAPPDDADGLAASIRQMIDTPRLFLERSEAAARRIRSERSNAIIIPRELALLQEAADGC